LRDAIVGTQRGLLWLVLSSSAILLLIACANVSQLLLARALRRSLELAVRASLGATRLRLVRQFVMEGLVLAGAGGTAGLFAAPLILGLLLALLPQRSPLLESARLDLRVVGFTAAVSLMSVIVFAGLPALKSSRWVPGSGLNARRAVGEGNRWRHAMIAFEAALSAFLLCGAGLLAQNLWALKSAPIGFDPANVVVVQLKLPAVDPGGLSPQSILPIQEYLERISAIPGVDSAATVTGPPLRRSRAGPIELVGVTDDGGALKSVIADIHIVSPEYFQTLRIPLIAGRTFRADDRTGRPRVAIVNEEFANRFGLGRDVVGRQSAEPGEPLTIVGMVGNVRTRGLRIEPDPEVYLSSLQFAWSNVYMVVRTTIPQGPLVQQIRATLISVNRDQAVYDVKSMDQFLADAVTEPRFNAFLTFAFALLTLAMVGTGMYSVVSYLVSQRTNEIAIRVALGASRRRIVGSVVGKTGAWVIAGLAVGMGLGLATRSTVRSLSNAAVDGSVWMYVSVAVLFFVVTLIAGYAPVRRALRLDPGRALSLE
jgi:predicted permease